MKLLAIVATCLAACAHSHAAPAPPAPEPPETEIATPPPPSKGAGEVKKFAADAMCVTHGGLTGKHVAESSMRAVARGSHGDAGTLTFSYDGPTKQVSHLKSGDVRE